MNTIRKSLLIGCSVLGLGLAGISAQAISADDGAAAHTQRGHGMFGAHRQAHMAKHLAKVHDLLKLNATQESGWASFAAAMSVNDAPTKPDRAQIRADMEKLSAPERLEKMIGFMQQGEERLSTRLAAMKTFYATLTPEQQKIFNDNIGPRHHGHWGRHSQ
ncbi:MAG: Spy/CpxP family protein refolding chaperone [Pseudomonadota bacterium]